MAGAGRARVSIASLAPGVSLVLAPPSHEWTQYTVVDLGGLPGSVSNHGSGINDRGEAIGRSGRSPNAVAWTRAGLVELGGLLASEPDTVARSISKRGDIVDDSCVLPQHLALSAARLLWRDGAMTDLGTLPGKAESYAAAINDHGEIVGFGTDASGHGDRAIMCIPKKGR